jgi:hypothetical protein
MQSAIPTAGAVHGARARRLTPHTLPADYRSPVEHEEIARGRRRDQVREHLEFERAREAALLDQLAEVITEEVGPEVDEAAFAQMAPEDVAVVREALVGPLDSPEEDLVDGGYGGWADDDADDEAEDEAGAETEIARLEGELSECRRRKRAHEHYLEALDGSSQLASD